MWKKINKLFFISQLVIILLCLTPQIAEAHTVLKDTTGLRGAVVFITPNDDPVAGESSTIFFEVSSLSDQADRYNADVSIAEGSVELARLSMIADQNIFRTDYSFPKTATYRLEFRVTPKSDWRLGEYVFPYELSVTRSNNAPTPKRASWLLFGLMIVSVIGLAAVIVLAVRRLK